ncbi:MULTISPECIES: 4-amino-4-deoxy-L-arabinose-phosphoundecaprenol flippase subunit ArnF [Serratia]|uniref:Probable 4-amino-4-deoxy-L-arabinose-phosphoundecaprenol flippase subunit ArnF n=1 Tax=Serratia proteamaculans TaxID=28151 RepID=A0A7U0RNN6_SERPR|nr:MULTISPECIES: 4-amino-4-deoxy-L-arabinose-phosphoundecaprenol flippase subunit ArnF [Serratia]MBO1502100.1 4-amino-4-deoxy-L-arabinose-phosphoundecaprenol flippase subunit ArnF [Serratia proteamaculans]MDW5508948.1 4-amino-4-deoxy-L-arabinose-phosphoundecaprenol flippase subunit ArnF [Serratia proteamaculans]QQX53270.1 4-amino-4-deoxy-L-arabinose-phosphoundecaprenol flippase subunit ArnF [Serratia proteamaculans]CAI1662287.1 Undecaprenyl phosphate-aminoarabinose flippase subunit ArnF [Serrat
MRGYAWGAASVLLVTLAQLLMKWGMAQIPLMSFADVTLNLFIQYWLPLLTVSGGIFGYALSMLCWFFALHHLPLNRAYPLLSVSYALVYLAAVILPWFNESATLLKTLGTLFILFGVWLINSQTKVKTPE